MKCGTGALHSYLDDHPAVSMSSPKELNFFFDAGNWRLGVRWYQSHFDASFAVRGESSPGYTSPDHPEAPARMAALLPGVRLVYAVRDPVERAVSQWLHHRRDGTEPRGLDEALSDPRSHYVLRGLYFERIRPYIDFFGANAVEVVAMEELVATPAAVLARLFEFAGVEPVPVRMRPAPVDPHRPVPSARTLGALRERFSGDACALKELCGRDFPGWSV